METLERRPFWFSIIVPIFVWGILYYFFQDVPKIKIAALTGVSVGVPTSIIYAPYLWGKWPIWFVDIENLFSKMWIKICISVLPILFVILLFRPNGKAIIMAYFTMFFSWIIIDALVVKFLKN
jgi:hypothetical protein